MVELLLDTSSGSIEPLEKPDEVDPALDESAEEPDEADDDEIGVDDPALEVDELRETLGKPSPVG